MPGGLRLPTRMTVIALGDGTLALHSPVAMSPELSAAVAALGQVAYVIAPSALHHVFVRPALERFVGAKLLGPEALARKRPRLRFDTLLETHLPAPLSDTLDMLAVAGAPTVEEKVFLHKPTGSLLVTDLLFNITAPRGFVTKLVLRGTGTCGHLAQSRLWRFYGKDRAALSASGRALLGWRFDRLVPCHGEVLETGAHAAVEQALRFK